MTREEIINGLKMSIDLMLFDPTTGEVKEPHQLNDMDRTSYEAFKGAMEILAQPQTKCIAKITLNEEQLRDAVEKAKHEVVTVLPQRKRGRWIPKIDIWGGIVRTTEGYNCSECHAWVDGEYSYCPWCGADMRGEQDDN